MRRNFISAERPDIKCMTLDREHLSAAQAQHFMDIYTNAIIESDIETYLKLTRFPFMNVASGGNVLVLEDQARDNLAMISQMYRNSGVYMVVREVQQVDMLNPDFALVKYQNSLLTRSGARQVDPYSGLSTLVRDEGNGWQITATICTIACKVQPLPSPDER